MEPIPCSELFLWDNKRDRHLFPSIFQNFVGTGHFHILFPSKKGELYFLLPGESISSFIFTRFHPFLLRKKEANFHPSPSFSSLSCLTVLLPNFPALTSYSLGSNPRRLSIHESFRVPELFDLVCQCCESKLFLIMTDKIF